MKKTRSVFVILIAFMSMTLFNCSPKKDKDMPEKLSVIPHPSSMEMLDQKLTFNGSAPISFTGNSKAIQPIAEMLISGIKRRTGLKPSIKQKPEEGGIILKIEDTISAKEGYHLLVNKEGVEIAGGDAPGLFYGIQTFLQLIPAEAQGQSNVAVPGVRIKDKPRFSYRGMHLDVCRHFFPVSEIKKLLEVMAMHKLNRFHWHLTEDQGWRIEIKKYPKLTEIGAWRDSTVVGHMAEYPLKYDDKRYGGFYTQEEVKEVVNYAQKLHITVIPEIEMPGHSRAAIAAYPELSCTGKKMPVASEWGIFEDIYCAGKEHTFEFLQNVLLEVFELFPSEYIHIGGDEAPKTRWENCEQCQRRIREEGLKNEKELQSYFIKRMEKFLNKHGKKLIGWDEILEGGLPERATVMSWRGVEGGIHAAKTGHHAIMTPTSHCYFDYYQAKSNEPLAIGGYLPLEKVYSFDPVPEDFTPEEAQYILGGQANVWTEYIPDTSHLEYMIFPRLSAMAEVLWSQSEDKDFESFKKRMTKQYKRYDLHNINYRVDDPDGFRAKNRFLDDTVSLKLTNNLAKSTIRYTTDGAEPNANSPAYEEPLKIKISREAVTLKAKSFLPSGKASRTRKGTLKQMQWQEPFEAENIAPGLVWHYYKGVFPNATSIQGQANKSGITDSIAFPENIADHHFGMIYEGLFYAPSNSVYTFHLTSNDGAVLQIDDKIIVNNDGHQMNTTKIGKAALKEGFHFMELRYFQAKYWKSLKLEYSAGETQPQPIPKDQFYHIAYNSEQEN